MVRKRRKIIKRKRVYKKRRNIHNLYIFRIISFCLLFGFGIFYLTQVINSSSKIYEYGNLQMKIDKLKIKEESLESKVADLQSMSKIKERINNMKMVAVKKIEYINEEKAVAVK